MKWKCIFQTGLLLNHWFCDMQKLDVVTREILCVPAPLILIERFFIAAGDNISPIYADPCPCGPCLLPQ